MEAAAGGGRVTLVLQTVVAMVLSLAVYLFAATIVSMVVYFIQSNFNYLRPGIIEFFAVIVGSFIGMGSAKAACEAVLRDYSRRSIFLMFCFLTMISMFLELVYVPMQWNQINSAAQIAVALITAYICFWQNEKVL